MLSLGDSDTVPSKNTLFDTVQAEHCIALYY